MNYALKIFMLLVIPLVLTACAEPLNHSQDGEMMDSQLTAPGIVGSKPGDYLSKHAKKVVLITGKITDKIKGKFKSKSFLCTGVLIAEDIVLTAAHCVGELKHVKIVFGSDPIHSSAQLITKPKSIIKHKGYNRKHLVRNDLALIQIKNKKPENYQIANFPWDPPERQKDLTKSAPFTVLGYGTTTGLPGKNKWDLRGAGSLRGTELNLTEISSSQDVFFADQTQGHAICSGDSGGPAFMGANTLVGLVSYNITDNPLHLELVDEDACNYQAVFTHIMYYKAWILEGILNLKTSNIN